MILCHFNWINFVIVPRQFSYLVARVKVPDPKRMVEWSANRMVVVAPKCKVPDTALMALKLFFCDTIFNISKSERAIRWCWNDHICCWKYLYLLDAVLMSSNCRKFLLSQRALSKLLKSASPNCWMINFKSSEVDKSCLIHPAWVWRGTVYLRLKRFYLMSFRNE